MVKKALLVAGLLFALYTLFFLYVKPHWSLSQHKRQQNNQIKAEKYLYTTQPIHSVVVGSSLASHVVSWPGMYNLALGGQSALDGLAIVQWQNRTVRTVLIEMNYIDREEDNNFTGLVLHPIMLPARRVLPSLRADKQPLAVVEARTRMILERLSLYFTTPVAADLADNSVEQNSYYDESLSKQLERYAQPPTAAQLEQQLGKVKQVVRSLRQRGTRVVFFEMPVDYRLCNSPRTEAIQQAFHRHFPPGTYRYVSMPDCAAYQTRDGLHLVDPSATKYTRFLREQLAKQSP